MTALIIALVRVVSKFLLGPGSLVRVTFFADYSFYSLDSHALGHVVVAVDNISRGRHAHRTIPFQICIIKFVLLTAIRNRVVYLVRRRILPVFELFCEFIILLFDLVQKLMATGDRWLRRAFVCVR